MAVIFYSIMRYLCDYSLRMRSSRAQPTSHPIQPVSNLPPNKYEIKENSRPLSGKMDKNPRKTLAETIVHQNKREPSPGPASYFTRPKTAEAKLNKHVPEYR